ncbi:SPASM domain-containing protein [uncultured Bacteroides sp.]|uniref:radical SAM protein n=1 Tax=uncultured Bacteroides sp. TaxID=162156 RepID=UPI0025D99546|nr:SPASM domain-containing protein [uncultured Bacteroides sp.]
MKSKIQIIEEFESLYPLVKVFEVYNKLFAYDAKTELLTEVDVDILMQYLKKPFSRNAIFSPGKLQKIVPDESDISILAKSQKEDFLPRKFVLEITEECTLRCRYCLFSNKENHRKHSSLKMDEDTAFKAIDYYFNLYINAFKKVPDGKKDYILRIAPPSLSWWGGEPFSNFELILKTKKYFESLPWEKYCIEKKELVYSIVTNFTLLNKDIINFIVSTNLYVFVSIDGNQEENDKNRIFKNGRGSFNCVNGNLNYMIESYPEICKERFVVQSVLADNINKKGALAFLKKELNINTPESKVLKVIGYAQRNRKEFISKHICNKFKEKSILNNYELLLDKIKDMTFVDIKKLFEVNKDVEQEFKSVLLMEKKVIFDNVIRKEQHVKHFSCPAGIDNIFISANGDIHICNKTDYSYPLGNVKSGLDITIIERFYSSFYKEIRVNCSNCWAFHFCGVCPASVLNDKRFVHPNKAECRHVKRGALINIVKYVMLLYNENLFDMIDAYFKEKKDMSFLNHDGVINIKKMKV